MKRILLRTITWTLVILVLAFVILLFPFDPPKIPAPEISRRVDLLNEKAAIETPHHTLGKKVRAENLPLFEKVERGEPLTDEESARYRVLYQSILKSKQHELSKIDHELTVLTDYMPEAPNNVGGQGIEGAHDHHDASSAANLAALMRDLEIIEDSSSGFFRRVRYGIAAYKDLDDIILHMATAPQTKSVPRSPETPTDELHTQYEQMMAHFKRAQFEPVNSPAYAEAVHAALDRYDAMAVMVQDRIYAALGPVERSLTGGWGSWRSLTPSLKGVTADRIPRD